MSKITLDNLKKVIPDITVPKEFLQKIYDNRQHNRTILKYYKRLRFESPLLFSNLVYKVASIESCNKIVKIDRYEIAKIKDYKSTNLCRDKFCSNCKKVKQAVRMSKYIPELEKYKDRLYHITLTQPNCDSEHLEGIIKKMTVKVGYLMRYLSGKKKIKDLDFNKWEYLGAVRSLEVTFKKGDYHPHYHIAIALDCDLGEKYIKNTYSYSYKTDKIRLFSEKEVLIQKIWYLLMNDQEVTKKAIDNLEEGYSCIVDRFKESDYAELFKYATKSVDEDQKVFTYQHFKNLYFALHSVKQIQGYGVFYRIKDEVTEKEIEKVEIFYNDLMRLLQKEESPVQQFDQLEGLLQDFDYTLISRKRILKHLIDSVMSE